MFIIIIIIIIIIIENTFECRVFEVSSKNPWKKMHNGVQEFCYASKHYKKAHEKLYEESSVLDSNKYIYSSLSNNDI